MTSNSKCTQSFQEVYCPQFPFPHYIKPLLHCFLQTLWLFSEFQLMVLLLISLMQSEETVHMILSLPMPAIYTLSSLSPWLDCYLSNGSPLSSIVPQLLLSASGSCYRNRFLFLHESPSFTVILLYHDSITPSITTPILCPFWHKHSLQVFTILNCSLFVFFSFELTPTSTKFLPPPSLKGTQ